MVMEPVYRAARDIFRHALDLVVEGPAIPAVQVALVFNEEIGGDRMKLSWHHPRPDIGEQRSPSRSVDIAQPPFAPFRRDRRPGGVQAFRKPTKHRTGKHEAGGLCRSG